MPTPNHYSPAAGADRPVQAPLQIICPHCGSALEVVQAQVAAPADERPPALPAILAGRWRQLLATTTLRRLVMLRDAAWLYGQQQGSGEGRNIIRAERSRVLLLVVLGMVLAGALLIWLGEPVSLPGGVRQSATIPAPSNQAGGTAQAQTANEAAIIDTLARYNRAESEAAALLSLEPLRPFIEPRSPFAERRAAELAERKRRNAPHRTILASWAIGQIAIAGTTATAITQETWSNQEAGAVAPEQATVRVSYTLRWDEASERWLIVESEQMGL